MNCPSCGQKTIGFFRWSGLANRIYWTCPHCRTPLRGSWSATITCVLVSLLITAVSTIAYLQFVLLVLTHLRGRAFFVTFVLSALVLFALLWTGAGTLHYAYYRRGHYVVRDDGTAKSAPADRMARRRRWLWSLGILAGSMLFGLGAIAWSHRSAQMKEEARIHYNQGVDEGNRGESDKAITDLSEAIRLDPTLTLALVSRADLYLRTRQLDKAMADSTEALRIDPQCALAYQCRAEVYNLKGQYDKAITAATEALRLEPTSAIAFLHRGAAYYKKGQLDKAIAEYTSAIELDPKFRVAYWARARTYVDKAARDSRAHSEIARSEYAKAVADQTQAIDLAPTDPDAYEARAFAYRSLGEKAKALADEAKATQLRR